MRISVIYRGRAIPLVWQVIAHTSSSVAYETYQALLDKAATLLPLNCVIVFLADRGFADTALMAHATRLGWHWRIRIKGCFCGLSPGPTPTQAESNYELKPGQAHFWYHVQITAQHYGPVHLALAHLAENGERWLVVSDEPTNLTTLDEYGLRFETSLIRSADALTRLGFAFAITTLYLVAQGTEVVKQGKRRWVDAHWFRGNSYLKIGWHWIRSALSKGWELLTRLRLTGGPDSAL